MNLLAPLALALGLLAIPILLLYMLRMRRRDQVVSSTLLWEQLTVDREANALWQRLRRNLLLILQLLILAAVVLALARPFVRIPGAVSGSLIVLLDASASMTATDVEGDSRFAAAQREVGQLISGLSGSDSMTIIEVGRTPRVLAAATQDREALRRALASAVPAGTAADWESAVALANAASRGLAEPRFVVVTDGGVAGTTGRLAGDTRSIIVGESDANLAITALAPRREEDVTLLLATVANVGATDREALLSLYIDGALADSRRLQLPPAADIPTVWTLPTQARSVEARLTPDDGLADHLAVDSSAFAMVAQPGLARVLLISEGNLFVEQLLQALTGYTFVRIAPDEWAIQGSETIIREIEPDLLVLDGVAIPEQLPPVPVLVIDPQPAAAADEGGVPAIGVTEPFTQTAAVRLQQHPIMEFVTWRDVTVQQARQANADDLETVVQAEGGSLVLAGEVNGQRAVVLTFDLAQTDLPLQIAFPVLMANIMDWLSPAGAIGNAGAFRPGEPVPIMPSVSTDAFEVIKPDGTVWTSTETPGEQPILLTETVQPGIYEIRQTEDSADPQPIGAFAVTFSDSAESTIAPQSDVALGVTRDQPQAEESDGVRELWPWLLAAGLALLALEWWFAHPRRFGRKPTPFLR